MKWIFTFLIFFSVFVNNIYGNIELADGNIASEREFPHNVAIMYYKRNWIGKLKRKQSCGGTLINSRTVLTAGHCARGNDRLEIQAGTRDISSNENGIIAKVVNKTFHYGFNPRCFIQNDVVLLHLEKDILEDGKIIRFAEIDKTPKIPRHTILTLPGWGEKEKSGSVEILEKVQLPLQGIELCNATVDFTECDDYIDEDMHLCAGDGVQEACHGDSGASLVRLKNGIYSQRWSVVGISSFSGIRSPINEENVLDLVCGRGYSGFTRIYPYIGWIWENTWKPEYKDLESPLEYIDETSKKGQYSCYGKEPSSSNVCHHLGKCTSLDTCVCDGLGTVLADSIFEEDCAIHQNFYRNLILNLVFSFLVISLCCLAIFCKIYRKD